MPLTVTIHRPIVFSILLVIVTAGIGLLLGLLGVIANFELGSAFRNMLTPQYLFGVFALSVVILIFQRTLRIWDISWRPLRTSSPLRGPATHTRQPAGLGLADIDRALRDSNLSAERRAELTTLLAARLDEARS